MSRREYRQFSEKVGLLDCGNEIVRWISADEARVMLEAGDVEALGTRQKVHAVRWLPALPENPNLVVPIRRGKLAKVHNHETYDNPRGVWTIDRIPRSARGAFTAVIDDVAA